MGTVRDGGLVVVVSQTHKDPGDVSSHHKDNQECTLQTDKQELKSGVLLSSALGVAVMICTMEMPRHRDAGHWQGQDFHSFNLFFPTKNCGLSPRATGSHRRLESWGQQLVGAAQRSRPRSLQPAPSAGSAGSGPLGEARLPPGGW